MVVSDSRSVDDVCGLWWSECRGADGVRGGDGVLVVLASLMVMADGILGFERTHWWVWW